MNAAEQLRKLLARNPFLPFAIRFQSGEQARIVLPDQAWLLPGDRILQVVNAGSAASNSNFGDDSIDVKRVKIDTIAEVIDEARTNGGDGPMTTERFDDFLKRRPFEPFTIHTADGAHISVISPEFASRTQAGRTIYVSTGGERTECIDLLLVTRLSAGVENPKAIASQG